MSEAAPRRATYDDVLASPPDVVAEVVQGVLHQTPRPALPHAVATSVLSGELEPTFGRGRGGPGGWVVLVEPEIHLGQDIVVPDVAAWRRQRLPELPDAPYLTLAPDWLCEVLSPSTRSFDRGEKLPLYSKTGITYVWLVEPLDKLVEVLRLDGETYRIEQTITGTAPQRMMPFDAIEFDVGALWAR